MPAHCELGDQIAAAAPTDAEWRHALTHLALGLSVLTVAMTPTAVTLARQWGQTQAYGQAWLVLPVLLYALGWHWRQAVLATRPRPCVAGIAATGGAAVVWAAAEVMNIDIGRQFALVLMVFGVVLAALGTSFIHRWWPALGLLVFLLPSADLLQPALRWTTAEGLYFTLHVLGLDVQRDGFMLTVGTHRYFVADGCSGLSHVTLLTFLGYAFGVLMYRSFWRVAVLALGGGVFGLLSNLVRVNSIVLLDYWRGSQMDLTSHGYVQWVSLLSALGAMMFVVARSEVDPVEPGKTDLVSSDDRYTSRAPWRSAAALWAGIVGVTVTTVSAAAANHDAAYARAVVPGVTPPYLEGWALVERPNTPAVEAGRPLRLTWRYSQGARHLQMDVIQARRHGDKLSEIVVAPPQTEGWRDIQRRPLRACSAKGCAGVIHQIWQSSATTSLRHTYVTFVVGDVMTASQLLLRACTGWAVLMGDAVNSRLIAITVDGQAISPHELHALLFAAASDGRGHSGVDQESTQSPGYSGGASHSPGTASPAGTSL